LVISSFQHPGWEALSLALFGFEGVLAGLALSATADLTGSSARLLDGGAASTLRTWKTSIVVFGWDCELVAAHAVLDGLKSVSAVCVQTKADATGLVGEDVRFKDPGLAAALRARDSAFSGGHWGRHCTH
jgi:hypothetical protein